MSSNVQWSIQQFKVQRWVGTTKLHHSFVHLNLELFASSSNVGKHHLMPCIGSKKITTYLDLVKEKGGRDGRKEEGGRDGARERGKEEERGKERGREGERQTIEEQMI